MLDGLLGRGFAAKCKSLIKLTKNRIEVIRRKRRATEKFLKKDIADLILNGLDINAYGRAEGLMVELILSSCYGFVEHCCEFVLKHLPVMQKLSGCPEECRMAVSSLMFAAARFSDLPELRDLRQICQERYGNSLEYYVNQEFAANLNFKSSTLEKKVCLMEEIASEFSINWDSKSFKIRMSRSSTNGQGHNAGMPNHLADCDKPSHGKDFTQKAVKNDVLLKKSPNHANDGYRFHDKEAVAFNRDYHDCQSKSPLPGNEFKLLNDQEVLRERGGRDNPLTEKKEVISKKKGIMPKLNGSSSEEKTVEEIEGGSRMHDKWGNTTLLRENHVTTTLLRENHVTTTGWKSPSYAGLRFKINVKEPFAVVNHVGLLDTDKSQRNVQKDETPTLKPCYSKAIPPPYLKPNSKQQNSTSGANVVSSHIDSDRLSIYFSAHEKPDAAPMSERIEIGLDSSDLDWQGSKHERPSKQNREKEFSIRENAEEVHLVKPNSVRRKHSRSRSNRYDASNKDTGLERKSRGRSRRRAESRQGLQILFDDERYQKAEEERIIDKLLIHYSKKPPILVPEKLRRNSKSHHANLKENSTRELLQNGSGDGSDETPEMFNLAPRSVSLPREQHKGDEVKKVFTRAATFQPDRSKEARHVHPKLPDYDDLAARLAALRGQ